MASLSEELSQISLNSADPSLEEIDDFLYFVRSDEIAELKEFLSSRSTWNINIAESETGNTALHYASANGHLEMVEFLISLESNLNIQNEQGNTPSHWACLNGQFEVFNLLCEKGADPFIDNKAGRNSIEEAAWYGHDKIVQFAIEKYQN